MASTPDFSRSAVSAAYDRMSMAAARSARIVGDGHTGPAAWDRLTAEFETIDVNMKFLRQWTQALVAEFRRRHHLPPAEG